MAAGAKVLQQKKKKKNKILPLDQSKKSLAWRQKRAQTDKQTQWVTLDELGSIRMGIYKRKNKQIMINMVSLEFTERWFTYVKMANNTVGEINMNNAAIKAR